MAKSLFKLRRYPPPEFSIAEEIAHAVTHGLGAWLATVGCTVLVVLSVMYGDAWRIFSVSVYGFTLMLLYLASTVYHSVPHPPTKYIFKILDHCSIYLLIAGTYTPFMLVTLRGVWGWSLFGVIWFLTICGIVFKLFFVNRFEALSTTIYIAMGWLAILAVQELWVKLPGHGFAWISAGGFFYTVGTIFFHSEKMRYHHAIWHLFVLAGSICHYFAVLFYIVPLPSP